MFPSSSDKVNSATSPKTIVRITSRRFCLRLLLKSPCPKAVEHASNYWFRRTKTLGERSISLRPSVVTQLSLLCVEKLRCSPRKDS